MLTGQFVCDAQDAALDKLRQRYTEAQIADLRNNGHHKYVGLLLFYSSSFDVVEEGAQRAPDQSEIAMVDLHGYDALRKEKEDVLVFDDVLGKEILLHSRARFESLLLGSLSADDRSAYLAYKSSAIPIATSKTP